MSRIAWSRESPSQLVPDISDKELLVPPKNSLRCSKRIHDSAFTTSGSEIKRRRLLAPSYPEVVHFSSRITQLQATRPQDKKENHQRDTIYRKISDQESIWNSVRHKDTQEYFNDRAGCSGFHDSNFDSLAREILDESSESERLKRISGLFCCRHHSETLSSASAAVKQFPEEDSGISSLFLNSTDKDNLLPKNPLTWTVYNVGIWLDLMIQRHSIAIDKNKFHMNGLGIALIPIKGYIKRLGETGQLLHQDYHKRLQIYKP